MGTLKEEWNVYYDYFKEIYYAYENIVNKDPKRYESILYTLKKSLAKVKKYRNPIVELVRIENPDVINQDIDIDYWINEQLNLAKKRKLEF